jgi:tellurite resistance protein
MTFNTSGTSHPAASSVLDAMIETMVLMAMADGTLQDAELVKLIFLIHDFIRLNPQYGSLTAEQFQEKYSEIKRMISKYGSNQRIKTLAQRLQIYDLRATAVYFAIAISDADKHADLSENHLLNTLQEAFGFSQADIQSILQAYNGKS